MSDPVLEDLVRRRLEYAGRPFDVDDADADPVAQFERWYAEAVDAAAVEPNAMTLSTVDADGQPQARYVLLRGIDRVGFRFYTNYESAKARQVDAAPRVALTFGWLELHRSVRITGLARRLEGADSDAYFSSRPRSSRIGAWASPQSRVLASRAALDERVADAESRFAGARDVPRPDFWGGYVVAPAMLEFWQGRPSRLHDRLRYRRADDAWIIERLAP